MSWWVLYSPDAELYSVMEGDEPDSMILYVDELTGWDIAAPYKVLYKARNETEAIEYMNDVAPPRLDWRNV